MIEVLWGAGRGCEVVTMDFCIEHIRKVVQEAD